MTGRRTVLAHALGELLAVRLHGDRDAVLAKPGPHAVVAPGEIRGRLVGDLAVVGRERAQDLLMTLSARAQKVSPKCREGPTSSLVDSASPLM